MATDLLYMSEMGIGVSEYVLIERDPIAASVAQKLTSFLNIPLTWIPDICDAHGSAIGIIEAAIFTPCCGPWSSLLDNPIGFDHPDAATFIESGRLRSELQAINPNIWTMLQTNRMHKKITHQAARQEELAGGQFVIMEASCFGSPSRRPRRYATVNAQIQVQHSDFKQVSTEAFISKGWRTEKVPSPCLVSAGPATRSPTVLIKINDPHMQRIASPDEADSLNGLPPGYSHWYGSLNFSDVCARHKAHRLRLTGQCLNQFPMKILLRYMSLKPHLPKQKIVNLISSSIEEKHPGDLEKHLFSMSYTEKKAWIRQRLEGWTPETLRINRNDNQQHSYQARYIPEVDQNKIPAVMKKLAKMTQDGRFTVHRNHKPDDTLSPMFFKAKPDRFDEDGDPLLRTLCDCVMINTLFEIPVWWTEYNQTIEEYRSNFPASSKRFCPRDFENAFELIWVHVDDRHYLVFVFRMKGELWFVQANVCVQGLALSAYFFPMWIYRLWTRAFGLAWTLWWSHHVDDAMVHGDDDDRCMGRNEIFEAIAEIAGLPISAKTPACSLEEAKGCGMVISEHGQRADDTVEVALQMRLDLAISKGSVTGIKQLQNLRGVIDSSRLAFTFSAGQHHKFAELCSPLNVCIKRTNSEGKVPREYYRDVAIPCLIELKTFIKTVPRAHIHPDDLITEDSCLILCGDSSDDAAGTGCYKVLIPDARDVKVPEDLQDPLLSTMVADFARAHDSDKVNWLTFENETEIVVEACEKLGKRICASLRKFDPKSEVKKISIYSDSSTARSISEGLTNPACRPEFHTAKARKWLNWSNRLYFTRNWPAFFAFCTGSTNDFADWLSHIGHLLKQAGTDLHNKPPPKAVTETTLSARLQYPVPTGWTLKDSICSFSPEQWTRISEATSTDHDSKLHKVSLAELLDVLTGGTTCSALVRDRVHTWKSKIFAIVPPGGSKPCLFTYLPSRVYLLYQLMK